MDLIKISPDEERIKIQNKKKMAALIISDYYEVIKELLTAILLVDGYKSLSHRDLIDYLSRKYNEFGSYEISILNDLRVLRNKISYEGFLVSPDYLIRNEKVFKRLIKKLKRFVGEKIS